MSGNAGHRVSPKMNVWVTATDCSGHPDIELSGNLPAMVKSIAGRAQAQRCKAGFEGSNLRRAMSDRGTLVVIPAVSVIKLPLSLTG